MAMDMRLLHVCLRFSTQKDGKQETSSNTATEQKKKKKKKASFQHM